MPQRSRLLALLALPFVIAEQGRRPTLQETVRRPEVADWVNVELSALSRGLASPAAWFRFLGASFRRWRLDGRSLPALRRSIRLWLLGCSSAAFACQIAARRAHPTRQSVTWVLGASLMADWHLGMIPPRDNGTPTRLALPNRLTLIRAFLPAAFAGLPDSHVARRIRRGACVISLFTDFLDGVLARRRGACTHFGVVADPLADGLFWTALAWNAPDRRFGRGLAWLATTRYIAPLAGALAISFGRGRTFDWNRSQFGRGTGAALSMLMLLRELWPIAARSFEKTRSPARIRKDSRFSGGSNEQTQ
jgi:phosphatidylglycerophosphate synthase